MSDQTEPKGLSDEERQANKAIYVGKRLYKLFVEVANELHSARNHEVTEDQLGIFADMDTDTFIMEARRIGRVPVWNAEDTPKGRDLTYKLYDGAKPVAQ